ncbi:hypothetical protein, partial [Paraburkholderia azotifigens]|uniref:hypothetical protein n=1 Tax=Paraburkholderia azotifigens TaxID=2057004 RepID=UPI0038BBC582
KAKRGCQRKHKQATPHAQQKARNTIRAAQAPTPNASADYKNTNNRRTERTKRTEKRKRKKPKIKPSQPYQS